DCSTQALKVVAVNESLQVVAEAKVDFSAEIPRFGTKSGVLLGPGGVVNAPVEMYIEALDLLMEKLKKSDFPFWKVSAVSGAGQQHALVLFSHLAPTILSPSHLSPLLPLAPQVLDAFSSPLVSNWQDSSTTTECLELEFALPGGREEMAQRTGSKAHERFTGPQVLKVVKQQKDVWENTSRVGIVSSWLATMLCLDGEVKGIDESDACGMDLFDIPSRTFNSTLCSAASRSASPTELLAKLGKVELDPSRVVGHIGQYFVDRYGFDKNCCVAPFTGDNPSTLLSFSLNPGDAIISLGTSDTVLLASNHYQPSPNFHVFSHPAGDSPDGSRRYMAMLCYKNGSLPRERLRNEFASGSWDEFNAAILATPLPTSSSLTTFNFDKPEIIPPAVHGTHIFRAGKRLEGGAEELSDAEKMECIRRGVESQFLSFKARVKGVLGGEGGALGGRLKRVFVAGGGSVK
ncbi:hypothetical protein BDY24DRAFT_337338, partial [Mrakia frigida]|uniref:xylulokinase n=1 Tax=Mrakia frigida TaxID=29902 RepID=UPI003FCC2174